MTAPRSGPLFIALVELQDLLKRKPINDRYTRALTKELRERAVEHAIDLIRRGCSRVDKYFRISRKEVIHALETFGPHEGDLNWVYAHYVTGDGKCASMPNSLLRSAHYAGLVHAALSTFGSLNDQLHSVHSGKQLTQDEREHLVRLTHERFGLDLSSRLDLEPDTVRAPNAPSIKEE